MEVLGRGFTEDGKQSTGHSCVGFDRRGETVLKLRREWAGYAATQLTERFHFGRETR